RQYFGGDLKALGLFAEERSTTLPDVPTAEEQGITLDIASIRGFLLPPDAPEEVVAHYAELFERALTDEAVVSEIGSMGGTVRYMGPEHYAGWWQQQGDDWERIARELGIYMAE